MQGGIGRFSRARPTPTGGSNKDTTGPNTSSIEHVSTEDHHSAGESNGENLFASDEAMFDDFGVGTTDSFDARFDTDFQLLDDSTSFNLGEGCSEGGGSVFGGIEDLGTGTEEIDPERQPAGPAKPGFGLGLFNKAPVKAKGGAGVAEASNVNIQSRQQQRSTPPSTGLDFESVVSPQATEEEKTDPSSDETTGIFVSEKTLEKLAIEETPVENKGVDGGTTEHQHFPNHGQQEPMIRPSGKVSAATKQQENCTNNPVSLDSSSSKTNKATAAEPSKFTAGRVSSSRTGPKDPPSNSRGPTTKNGTVLIHQRQGGECTGFNKHPTATPRAPRPARVSLDPSDSGGLGSDGTSVLPTAGSSSFKKTARRPATNQAPQTVKKPRPEKRGMRQPPMARTIGTQPEGQILGAPTSSLQGNETSSLLHLLTKKPASKATRRPGNHQYPTNPKPNAGGIGSLVGTKAVRKTASSSTGVPFKTPSKGGADSSTPTATSEHRTPVLGTSFAPLRATVTPGDTPRVLRTSTAANGLGIVTSKKKSSSQYDGTEVVDVVESEKTGVLQGGQFLDEEEQKDCSPQEEEQNFSELHCRFLSDMRDMEDAQNLNATSLLDMDTELSTVMASSLHDQAKFLDLVDQLEKLYVSGNKMIEEFRKFE